MISSYLCKQNIKSHSLQESFYTKPVGGVIQDRWGVCQSHGPYDQHTYPWFQGFCLCDGQEQTQIAQGKPWNQVKPQFLYSLWMDIF